MRLLSVKSNLPRSKSAEWLIVSTCLMSYLDYLARQQIASLSVVWLTCMSRLHRPAIQARRLRESPTTLQLLGLLRTSRCSEERFESDQDEVISPCEKAWPCLPVLLVQPSQIRKEEADQQGYLPYSKCFRQYERMYVASR